MPSPPLPDHRFVGRVEDLWAVHDLLHDGKTAVVRGVGQVTGTGGLGKTQLAIEYVHRFCGHYPGGIFWVSADRGRSALIDQVAEGAAFDIDGRLEEAQRLQQLWRLLSQSPPALIVLDNFPEQKESLETWLPVSGPVHTLVTTRRRDLGQYPSCNLGFLADEESIQLLSSGQRRHQAEGAAALLELLGGLPLALELARSHLDRHSQLSPNELAERIRQVGEMQALTEFADRYHNELPSRHEKEVAATFLLSWQLASPSAQAVLEAMSLLAPQAVPRRLLGRMVEVEEEASALADPLDDAIQDLVQLSLAELDEDGDPWAHRLLLGFVASTRLQESKELPRQVAQVVGQELERVADDADTTAFRELEKVLPHGELLSSADGTELEAVIDLCNYLGWHHRKWGRYRLGAEWRRKALQQAQDGYPPDHPAIAVSQSNLALVLKDLGELEEARDLLRTALESDQRSFEPGHPTIAVRQSNLALVLKDLGELEEARDLLRAAHKSLLEGYGPDFPKTKTAAGNLAVVEKAMEG
ncbi:MAG: tetratricopeptide repeat protein [Acidobacteriota bacterium]